MPPPVPVWEEIATETGTRTGPGSPRVIPVAVYVNGLDFQVTCASCCARLLGIRQV